jgi:hypothetical protein
MKTKPIIPSMGGRELGPVFSRYIEVMDSGLDVVEVGAWLGAGTLELATAMKKHGHAAAALHCYDRFEADRREVIKAAGGHKYPKGVAVDGMGSVRFRERTNTLPIVQKFLKDFPFIKFYKGDVGRLVYSGRKIGVLVVDTAKREPHFSRLMGNLEPHLAAGAVVVLMDYWFGEVKRGTGTECQAAYVATSGRYQHLETCKALCTEVLRYAG